MTGYQVFRWAGKPIPDIKAWAKSRGEAMIHYRYTKQTVYGPEIEEGDMPESFWNSLIFTGHETYEKLG